MRGKSPKRRKVQRDERYGSALVARLINKVMQDGKKTLAKKAVYEAIEEGAKQVKMEPVEFLETALKNARPSLEIKARRVGGANYQVPMPVSPARQDALAVRWIVDFTRASSGTSFGKRLLKELVDAFNGEGSAIRKKVDVEKMAEANKAFAHFRW
jgi:small subunit ribosomal protein S7